MEFFCTPTEYTIMIERCFRGLKAVQLTRTNTHRPHEALDDKVPNEVYFSCFAT